MTYSAHGLVGRVFSNRPGDWGTISCPFIPKTKNMVLDSASLNIRYYKVWIKGSGAIQGKE